MSNKNFKKGIIVFAVIIAVVIVFTILSITRQKAPDIVSVSTANGDNTNISISIGPKTKNSKKIKSPYLAVVTVEGTIQVANNTYNQEWILSVIQKLKEDPKNLGLVLFINSPGGTVYQADEVYLALQDYKTSGKKIGAYMGSMAASGGYYIACAADYIVANRNTLTGSIGVVAGQSLDLTGFFEKYGIKSETIHAGKNKNMMNYNEPFTAEQKAIMQSIADECYEQFVSIVSQSRDIPYNELVPLCDGRIYTAKQALEHGLIDEVNTYDKMIEYFTDEIIGKPDCKVINLKYEKKQGLMGSVLGTNSRLKDSASQATGDIPEAVWENLLGLEDYPAYIAK